MLKKIYILFLIFAYTSSNILNIALFEHAFGAGISLTLQQVSLDLSPSFSNPSVQLSVQPNQEFRFESLLQNNEATSVTNVSYYTNFPANIVYSGTTRAATQVNGSSTAVIPLVSYNPPTIPNYINGLSTLTSGSIYAMKRNILKFPSDHSVYENTLSAYFTANNGVLLSNSKSNTIYVNVRPHITDYYFSKSSIVSNGMDSIDLYVKVKDYNGCTNIDTSKVIADLSDIGGTANTQIPYQECEIDGKTAIFKYSGITTLSGIGDKVFSNTKFSIVDEDGNQNTPNDSNTSFDDEDKKSDITLTVASPVAPVVTFQSNSREILSDESGFNTTDFAFSSDMGGEYKIVVNGNGTCSNGTAIQEWTSYATGNTITQNIVSSVLSEGSNTIYACVKNATGDIGSLNINLEKDTQAPTISGLHVTPATVVANNATGSLYCSESGQYRFGMNGNYSSYLSVTKDIKVEQNIPNGWLNIGENFLYGYCKDAVGNISSVSVSITKESLPPAMTSSGLSLTDNDVAWDGVDGRDIKITFDNSIGSAYSGFGAYVFYLLPQGTSFTGVSIGNTTDKNATSWIGKSDLLNDSLGNPLSSGNYDVYVAILGQSLNIGTPAFASGILVSDIVPHPIVLSAKFTAQNNLQVQFNTPLKEGTGSHAFTGFEFTVGSNNYTGTSIRSVNADTIDVEIPNLPTTYATGLLTVHTGAIWGVPVDGSYNYGTGNFLVSDNIQPTIMFATGTLSPYNGFYSGSLNLSYSTSEELLGGGNTRIEFRRTGGNADGVNKSYFITDNNSLTAGTKNLTLDLTTFSLVSGSYYDVVFVAVDKNYNTSQLTLSNIKYDKNGPGVPSMTPFGPNKVLGLVSPNFVWLSTTDDSGNGSGIKGYKLRIYNGTSTYGNWNSCSGTYTDYDHTDLGTLSKSITLANNNNYAWGVYAYDQMGNVGQLSSCDNFYIDTNVPSFSLGSVTDSVLNSTSYTKGGNNLVVKATISNTNSGKIFLNASTIKDATYANISCSSPVSGVTCTYNSNIATYTFSLGASSQISSGLKQLQFTAANTSGINTGTYLVSTTLDNTPPVLSSPLISPTSGVYGGTGMSIVWNPAFITDNIGLSYVKGEYFDGGAWHTIFTGANNGSYNWDISSLSSGNNYQVKLSAYDAVGLSGSFTGGVFIIDKQAPVVSSSALTYPSVSGIRFKGGQNTNITWNPAGVTDVGGLATSPISLYYSSNGGTSYTLIASGLPNSGSYSWTVPAGVNSTTYKIKLVALDNVGNTAFDESDNNFEIDSTSPTIQVTYAGNGGATPTTNNYINNSGFDVSGLITDTHLDSGIISYSLYNQTSGKYFDGATYTSSTEVWNALATASGISYNLASSITSPVVHGNYYKLKLKASDQVGNESTTSQITYIGDTQNPSLAVSTLSGAYFSESINISGTSTDVGAGVSSVKISIKKGSEYWDGNNFVSSEQILSTSTSNTYANWNYIFTPSLLENDGQNYTVIAYVYDRSYKVNNVSNQNISIVLDKNAPEIQSNIFTFSSTGILSGGNNLAITWNTAGLSDSGVGLDANPISLEFFNGSLWQPVISNIANNGTYNYTLPNVDTSLAKIRMKARDAIGNESTYVLSDAFSVDSTNPTIESVETKGDTLGNTSGFIVTLSEKLQNPGSINIAALFSVSNGITLSNSYLQSENNGKTILELSFTAAYTGTSLTPTLFYNGSVVTDLAGRYLASGNRVSTDSAEPRIISAQMYDQNANGKFDFGKITFSENILSTSDITAFTLNNPLSGMNIVSVSISGNAANIILSESLSSNTDSSGITLSFASNSNWKDISNNTAGSLGTPIVFIDSAAPVLMSGIVLDNNTDYLADTIELQYSESFTGTLTTFTLSTGSIISTTLVGGNMLRLGVNNLATTSPNVTMTYTGTISDLYGNSLAGLSNYSLTEKIAPKVISLVTLDTNHNGKIDALLMNTSETLAGNISDLNINVLGYTLTSGNPYTLSGSSSIQVSLDEKSIFDTSSTPTVDIISNNLLTDVSGNKLLSTQTLLSSDGVGPVIISSRFDEGQRKMYLDFSEAVVGNLNPASFVLSGSLETITNVTFSSGSFQAVLDISGVGINYGTTEISFASSSIADANGNIQSTLVMNKINGSVVINEVMSDAGVSYIELKNLSSAGVDISGYILENALGNGVHYSIPASQILPASGYYLIATGNTEFSGITANQISALNIGNNIFLKNGSVLVDTYVYQTPTIKNAFERIDGCGNGASLACWSQSVASTGFTNTLYKGTPKTANILDTTLPTLGVNISDNDILPIGNYAFHLSYSDNIEINTGSLGVNFSKWDGNTFVHDVRLLTGSVNATGATYTLSGIEYGKYKLQITLSDTAGNGVNIQKIFYVDNFAVHISSPSIDLGVLSPNVQKIANTNLIITLQTIGASVQIGHSYSGTLLPVYNSGSGYGGCVGVSCTALESFINKTIANISGELQSSGALKTYTYEVRYGAHILDMQEAGNYNINNTYTIGVNY